ncbi:MAG: M24 family metallopeptidase [Chitinophagaceae bacterium]|nr:M24 family metallopeptidase [Chitinophagaceae bacterium]
MKKIILLLALCWSTYCLTAQPVLTEREQSKIVDEILEERFQTLLPVLMKRSGIDMWLLISREYNEDPVLKTMLPSTWLSARRTTMLVFYLNPATQTLERFAIARYNVGNSIKAAWDLQKFPDQWNALADLIQKKNPSKIGINTSLNFGHADGLDHTHYERLVDKLPASFKNKLVSAESLAVGWLESRTERELEIYQKLIGLTHEIIAEGFSSRVITPGVTTTDDLVWWFRQRVTSLGLTTWFHPSVSVQRSDTVNFEHLRSFSNRPENEVILPGDLLHVDFGITYLRLNTDVQQHAYVLRRDETDAPAYLQKAFATSNRLQDILIAQFKTGRTGNEILKAAREQAIKEGIKPSIYSHPLGLHGHAAGPTIGLWDQQEGVAGSGDYPVYPSTAYSIELNSATYIPEWGKEIRIMLEEDGYFNGRSFLFLAGRQEKLRLIKYF